MTRDPRATTFMLLSFEGPFVYKQPRMVVAQRSRGKATAKFAAQRHAVKLPVQEVGPSERRVPRTLRSLTKEQ